ncbi:MAG: ElyC/SanA/YdcF family protein [Clostridiaceae bacterium]
MKKTLRIILSMLLVISMSLPLSITALASENTQISIYSESRRDAPQEVRDLVAKLISFYGEGYRVDVIKHLEDLKEISPEWHEIWSKVFDYWDWIEEDMVENIGVAPDGIENSQKHAFIVLGFALNNDGTMTEELIGRLEVAKASAEKYPNSYVLVTGGVEKNGWTEGRRMFDWLVENGVAPERIIVEEKAPDTAGNASNSFEMLYKDYDVDSVSLITTQYHLKRGSILYYAESLLKAKELGVEPIAFIGEANAGWYRPDKTEEPLSLKANSMRAIAAVPRVDISTLHTVLQGIEVSGKKEYIQGEELDILVRSIDDKGYNVDLTKYATITGFDSSIIGEQILHITYVQNQQSFEAYFTINITEAPEETVDREELRTLVKSMERLSYGKYTNDSAAYLREVLREARKTLKNPDATQLQVNEAVNRLNNAYLALER